jgi:hypothetical protein
MLFALAVVMAGIVLGSARQQPPRAFVVGQPNSHDGRVGGTQMAQGGCAATIRSARTAKVVDAAQWAFGGDLGGDCGGDGGGWEGSVVF